MHEELLTDAELEFKRLWDLIEDKSLIFSKLQSLREDANALGPVFEDRAEAP